MLECLPKLASTHNHASRVDLKRRTISLLASHSTNPEQITDGEPEPYPWAIAMRGKNPGIFDVELLNPSRESTEPERALQHINGSATLNAGSVESLLKGSGVGRSGISKSAVTLYIERRQRTGRAGPLNLRRKRHISAAAPAAIPSNGRSLRERELDIIFIPHHSSNCLHSLSP